MNTVRRLIHGEIVRAVAFVGLAFLALFLFFDLVDELQNTQRYAATGYRIGHALLYISLKIPTHLYELAPISVLIGSIFVMARFAQSSEYTILRTGGLGPWRALSTLFQLGIPLVLVTFLLGDYLSPMAEKQAQLIKSRFFGQLSVGQTGAWLKEKHAGQQRVVNIKSLNDQMQMQSVRIQSFDPDGQLRRLVEARSATFETDHWVLSQVRDQQFLDTAPGQLAIKTMTPQSLRWDTGISVDMVSAALISPDRMKTWDLFQYIRHLSQNNQNAQRYEIEFWRKVFYPLSCLVMLSMALPFAYLHFRSGNIAGHVFGGVLAGISFHLLNNLFGHIGTLQNWQPMFASAAPSLLYCLISLATFWWLVLRH
jgi:lipopolysaccharide export system permease protein